MRHTKIYAGSSSPEFAQLIVQHIGISVGKSHVTKFSNKETSVTVRGGGPARVPCDGRVAVGRC